MVHLCPVQGWWLVVPLPQLWRGAAVDPVHVLQIHLPVLVLEVHLSVLVLEFHLLVVAHLLVVLVTVVMPEPQLWLAALTAGAAGSLLLDKATSIASIMASMAFALQSSSSELFKWLPLKVRFVGVRFPRQIILISFGFCLTVLSNLLTFHVLGNY